MTNWGSIPEWIGGVGSLLSTLVVGGGLWYEVRQRRLSDLKAEAERVDAQAAWARLVTVEGQLDPDRYLLDIHNDSDAPIRHLAYTLLWTTQGDTRRVPITDFRPGNSFIRPGDVLTVDCRIAEVDLDASYEDLDAEVEFTDLHGLRWAIRVSDDSLRRVIATA